MTGALGPEVAVDVALVGFARALRAGGVPVTPARTAAYLQAVAEVGAADPAGTYWAGRATLCSDPEQFPVYDAVHAAWFGGAHAEAASPARQRLAAPMPATAAPLTEPAGPATGRPQPARPLNALAAATELLRHRDVADLGEEERREVARLLAALDPRPPSRSSARRRPDRRGELDLRRTLREHMRPGEPGRPRWRQRASRSRRVVWLIDVSGSMAPYADSLLRLAHASVHAGTRPGVEVFTIGTRLTRVTPALRHRDTEQALHAAGQQVPDWAGGTRVGEVLRAFCDRWGQRGLARGAVVVVCSDGWERGDPALLAAQAARLRRLAYRLVWVNPHRGKPGYLPVQAGIAAVLPHVDDFVAGHSLAAFAEVLEVVARA